MPSIEVGLAIGIIGCPEDNGCPGTSQMGTVLYTGPFEPENHPGTPGAYQNFTLTVPSSDGPVGDSRIGVARTFLIGVSGSISISSISSRVDVGDNNANSCISQAENGAVLQTYGVEVETVSE